MTAMTSVAEAVARIPILDERIDSEKFVEHRHVEELLDVVMFLSRARVLEQLFRDPQLLALEK